jgi:hypothetical protein
MRAGDKLPPDKQDEYILLQTNPYIYHYGWKAGDKLKRVSKWLSGNGCGVKQAYFVPVDKLWYLDLRYKRTVWQDHVTTK